MSKDTVTFVVFIALLLGLGIALITIPWDGYPKVPAFVGDILPKVGEAMIVAGILAVVVDRYLKRRILTEVARDVSPYVVGYMLPAEVKAEVKSLLTVESVRRNMEVACKFSTLVRAARIFEPADSCSIRT